MVTQSIHHHLNLLRQAADDLYHGWLETKWKKISGPGPDFVTLDGAGFFHGLTFVSGQELVLECELELPSHIKHIPVEGDILQATLMSLYPTQLEWNGQLLFTDTGVPVAAGPALVTVIPSLKPGKNGVMKLTVMVPQSQPSTFFNLRFTTQLLREHFELIDTAWSELALANQLSTTEAEQRLLHEAMNFLPDDLHNFNWEMLSKIEQKLSTLSEKTSRLSVHLIGHSHIDMNWMWLWQDTVNVIRRDFKNVLSLMKEFPELTFTHSQPATYEVIREHDPDLFKQVVDYIQKGRWEPATMSWVEADANMVSGEALARHLTESVWYSRESLRSNPTTFLAPDTFGHAGNLPQAIASAGGKRYYHHRCNPGKDHLLPAYWWEGQDGTRILAISTHSYNGEIRARDLAEAAIRALKHGQTHSLHFHGVGDHGGGPARQNLEALRRFQNRPLLPLAQCSTLEKYTDALLNSGVKLPVIHGESSTIFEGCYTTHSDIKRFNRQGENLLYTADTLSALAGVDSPAELQSAWRTILFNQFHDILDGSAIKETYEKAAHDYSQAFEMTQSIIDKALTALTSGQSQNTIAVVNPSGWERRDWVVIDGIKGKGNVTLIDENGNRTYGQFNDMGLGFVARVAAFGINTYQVLPNVDGENFLSISPSFAPTDPRQFVYLAEQSEEPPYYKVETPHFRVYIRRDSGIFVSFFDKRVNRELVSFGMRRSSDYLDTARPDLAFNVFQFLEEYPHGMSSWHLDEVHTEFSLIRGAKTRILEEGWARIVLEVKHTLRNSEIDQKITFYNDIPRVDFETEVDWKEVGGPETGIPNLKVAFTARLNDCEAWYETPFAAVRRPADGQEVPALRWADVGSSDYGFAILNDCKYGYDALGSRLRLTLLRSGYDPDIQSDIGRHYIRYSFMPHPASWREAGVLKEAIGFNQPLLVRLVHHGTSEKPKVWKPFFTNDGSIIVSCFKRAFKENGYILRLYEGHGQASSIQIAQIPASWQVWETNIVEDRLQQLFPLNGRLELHFSPWQIRTFLFHE